ncbi:aminopeptidase P family protein [Sinomicrobium weinanense]|uniref:Xaa-Pro aminopeptidase n=1 Tax=Sinomicrobium weinanense TaxID=2842200 RepID=A0A926Q0P9_9FLAO|nr:aminopeptidase P family protein [Sinomicrobium weinanense]MBC9794993.1 aminopeptidase P family protein [Sinomicrobium weinanense]MBU3125146.1 aminopeptidase P family protein [Sinomicrobium weinanense]
MFSRETYIARRQELKTEVKQGILLFPGNGESSMNYKDNWYPFRQDSSFLYYTGINNIPGIYFVIDIENDREILFGDDPTPEEMVWIGAATPLSDLAERSGISGVKPFKELSTFLARQKQKGNKIHFLPPYRSETTFQLSNFLGIPVGEVEKNKSEAFIKAVAKQRAVKSPEEIRELHKAVNITAKMHTYAIQNAVPGKTEKEIAGDLQAIAIGGGGNISFPIILTKNGQYLHNHATQAVIEEGDLILCDCGAETAMNYAGDMTRTFPAGKTFSPLQKQVYNIVLNAHNSAVEALKPGVRFKDIHLLACTRLTEGLKEMGLMKGNTEEAVAAGAHTLFFQCGLGHMMGMDVHDMENLGEAYVGYTEDLKKSTAFGLKSLRLGKALEPGYVLTVEPGIYFNPFLIDSWRSQKKYTEFVNYDEVEKFKGFGGIRVEEDFVITPSGSELLGEPLAKTPEDIENLKNV